MDPTSELDALARLRAECERAPGDPARWREILVTGRRIDRFEAGARLVRDDLARAPGRDQARLRAEFFRLLAEEGFGYGDPRLQYDGRIEHLVLDRDGARLAAVLESGEVRILETRTFSELVRGLPAGRLAFPAFAEDGAGFGGLLARSGYPDPGPAPVRVRWDLAGPGGEVRPGLVPITAPPPGFEARGVSADLGLVLGVDPAHHVIGLDPAGGPALVLAPPPGATGLGGVAAAAGGRLVFADWSVEGPPDDVRAERGREDENRPRELGFFAWDGTARARARIHATGPAAGVFAPDGTRAAATWPASDLEDISQGGPDKWVPYQSVRLRVFDLGSGASVLDWSERGFDLGACWCGDGSIRVGGYQVDPRVQWGGTRSRQTPSGPAWMRRATRYPHPPPGGPLPTKVVVATGYDVLFAHHLDDLEWAGGGPLLQDAPIDALGLPGAGGVLATTGKAGTQVFSLASGARLIASPAAEPCSVLVGRGGDTLLVLAEDKFDVYGFGAGFPEPAGRRSFKVPYRFRPHGTSPDGRLVLGSADGGMLLLLDAATGREELRWRVHAGPVRAALFGPGGKVFSLGEDRTLVAATPGDPASAQRWTLDETWARTSGSAPMALHPHFRGVALATDGALAVFRPGIEAPIPLLDGLSGRGDFAIDRTGTRLAWQTRRGEIELWAFDPDAPPRRTDSFKTALGHPRDMAFAPDGRRLYYTQACHVRVRAVG